MTIRKIAAQTRATHLRVGIVVSRFNGWIGDKLLEGALRALTEAGVPESSITVAGVPGAKDTHFALPHIIQGAEDFEFLSQLEAAQILLAGRGPVLVE